MKSKALRVFEKRNFNLYIMLIPAILGFFIFQYLPILGGILISFKKYDLVKGLLGSDWVGFNYFIQFFEDIYFTRLLRNTVVLGVYSMIWCFFPPIILAIMINEASNKYFKRLVQSVTYLPYFISVVVIVGIMFTLLGNDGIINDFIASIGIERVNFISNPAWFRSLYIVNRLWQLNGFYAVIYLGALMSIDQELYQAAKIDGANRIQQIIHISLAGIAPTIRVILVLSIGNIVNLGFEKVYLMYSPAVYETADVLQTYVYRRGIESMDYGYAGAVSLFNSIISIILLYVSNYFTKKSSGEGLW